jgi:hypothetical protein
VPQVRDVPREAVLAGGDEMQSWVHEHHVAWEMRPMLVSEHGAIHPVGYELTLSVPVDDLVPACASCLGAFAHLQDVAAAALPDGRGRRTVCRIRPFDNSVHLRSGPRRMEPEIQVTVELSHAGDYFQDIDECEKRCARELQDRLRSLGAVPVGSTHSQRRTP